MYLMPTLVDVWRCRSRGIAVRSRSRPSCIAGLVYACKVAQCVSVRVGQLPRLYSLHTDRSERLGTRATRQPQTCKLPSSQRPHGECYSNGGFLGHFLDTKHGCAANKIKTYMKQGGAAQLKPPSGSNLHVLGVNLCQRLRAVATTWRPEVVRIRSGSGAVRKPIFSKSI